MTQTMALGESTSKHGLTRHNTLYSVPVKDRTLQVQGALQEKERARPDDGRIHRTHEARGATKLNRGTRDRGDLGMDTDSATSCRAQTPLRHQHHRFVGQRRPVVFNLGNLYLL